MLDTPSPEQIKSLAGRASLAATPGRCIINSFFRAVPFRVLLILFAAGLVLRVPAFFEPHDEGDEVIYTTLVHQLEAGKGYTLQGTPIVEYGLVDRYQYDRPLFFHPPGGVGLFWLFHSLVGPVGLPVVQVLSFVVFFWSMVAVAYLLGLPPLAVALVGLLSAFNPIMVHVNTHYWLDGPLLAFSTLSAAVFVWAARKKSCLLAVAAGLILGYASLIKITAFLVIPGTALLAWFFLDRPRLARFLGLGACLFVPAFLVQLPWEIWQTYVYGSPFPGWAGKPSATLVESNPYVRFLTVTRSPWVYVSLVPRIMWTLVPALVLFAFTARDKRSAGLGAVFILWVAVVLAFHVVLGAQGYSKVVRYVILLVPGAILLFSMSFAGALERFRQGGRARWVYGALIVLSVGALGLEAAAGIKSAVLYGKDLIFPFLGGL